MVQGCQSESEPDLSLKEGTLTVQPLQNISVKEGQQGQLRVHASLSGFNSSLTYSWQCYTGELDIEIQGLGTSTITFTVPKVDSDSVFSCRVNVGVKDGYINYSQGLPAINQSIIRILDMDPAIDAGDNREIASGAAVELNGVNLNSNVNNGQYIWTQLSGLPVDIENTTNRVTSFMAPTVAEASELSFQLQITNTEGETASDTVVFSIMPPTPPVISLRYDENVNEQTEVMIDASNSSDDLGIKSYRWRQVSGMEVELAGVDASILSFIAPVTDRILPLSFELTLIDKTNLETKQILSLNIQPVNEQPVVVLSGPSEVDEKTQVVLDASGSYDPDGEIVSYRWVQLSGTRITTSNLNSSLLRFTAPVSLNAHDIRWEVSVTDELGRVTRGQKTLTINPVTAIPVLNVSGPTTGVSNETVRIVYQTSDISHVYIEQVKGTQSIIPFARGLQGADIQLPIVNQTEILKFKITARDDDDKTNVEELLEIQVSRPENLTQINFPIHGGLITTPTTTIQGRSTFENQGVEANIRILSGNESIETTSDSNGYWSVQGVKSASYISATTTYFDGSTSNHYIQLDHDWSAFYNAQDHIENCSNNTMFHIWPENIMASDCSGKYKKTLASAGDGKGVDFSNYTDVAFNYHGLYLTTPEGLIYVDSGSLSNTRSYVIDENTGLPIQGNLIKVDNEYIEGMGWTDTAIIFNAASDTEEYFSYIILETGAVTPLVALNSAIVTSNVNHLISDYLYSGFRKKILLMSKSGETSLIDLEGEIDDIDFVEGRGGIISPIIGGHYSNYFIASKVSDIVYTHYSNREGYKIPRRYFDNNVGIKSIAEYSGYLYMFTYNSPSSFIKTNDTSSFRDEGLQITSEWRGTGSKLVGALNMSASNYQEESKRLILSSNKNLFTYDLDTGFSSRITNGSPNYGRLGDQVLFNRGENSIYHYSNNSGLLSELDLASGEHKFPPLHLDQSNKKINYMGLNYDATRLVFQTDLFNDSEVSEESAFYSMNKVLADDSLFPVSPDLTLAYSPILGSSDTDGKVCYSNENGSQILVFDSSTNTSNALIELSDYPDVNGNVGNLACSLNDNTIFISHSQTHLIYKLDINLGTLVLVSPANEQLPLGRAENIYFDADKKVILHVSSTNIIAIDVESGSRALLYKN